MVSPHSDRSAAVPVRAEVAVLGGGGAAGCVCGLLLARRGVDVAFVHAPAAPGLRPPELLSPRARRALRRLGVSDRSLPGEGRRCRGVLSRWERDLPDHLDYELVAFEAALVVDRDRLDRQLLAAAAEAGVEVVAGRAVGVTRASGDGRWAVAVSGRSPSRVEANIVVEATGRGVVPRYPRPVNGGQLRHVDRQVALVAAVPTAAPLDLLLIEASDDGWWYAASPPDGVPRVVYSTDADLVPGDRGPRVTWLRERFRRLTLIPSRLVGAPSFDRHRVTSARTACRPVYPEAGWVRIGDAGWTLDPLSGDGITRALTSARRAAEAVCAGGEHALADFARASALDFERGLVKYASAYGAARAELRRGTFWRRRLAAVGAGPVTASAL